MTPDIIINVRFLTPAEGGRERPVHGQSLPCSLCIGDEGFDCRLLLDGRHLAPGQDHEVPVRFLYPRNALPRLQPGSPIRLWDGQYIAQGKVLLILERPPVPHGRGARISTPSHTSP